MLLDHGPFFALPLFYLDPGSGSFLVQLLLGAGLSVAVAVKLYWSKLKGLITGKKPDLSQPPDDSEDE